MKYIYSMFFILSLLTGCKEENITTQLKVDGVAPGEISSVVVENLPGSAKINYELPLDRDILYVEARYMLADGTKHSVKSSFNAKSITVEGFSDKKVYPVKLIVVDKSGNKSKETEVEINPLDPPIHLMEKSLKMQADFGGVRFSWENEMSVPMALLIYGSNDKNEEILIDTYYSDRKEGSFVLRGQAAVEKDFTVVIRDKWDNLSSRITKRLTPIYEVKLDSKKFVDLGKTFRANVEDASINAFWNGNREDNAVGASVIPWNASFYLGNEAKLSRIIIWQYSWPFNDFGHYYAGGNARVIRIYGSQKPNPSGALDESWTLIKTCEIVKPSGLPVGIGRTMMSEEDFDIAKNRGHEYIVPLEAENVRYVRIEVTKGWEGTLGSFSELELYGAPIN